MKSLISIDYPAWYIVLCLLLGVAYGLALYFKNKKNNNFSRTVLLLMFSGRTIVATILALLLLSPLIKHETRRLEKPILAIAVDNSQSMLLSKDSLFIRTELQQKLEEFKNSLSDKYDVNTYNFGEKTRAELELNYNDKLTSYESLLDAITTNYTNRNYGATVLLSDGIYNIGRSPINMATNFNAPIYTVAFGDTIQRKDLTLNNVYHNNIAFLGNKFPVQVNFSAFDLKGQSGTISIRKNGEVISQKPFSINDHRYSTQELFELDANQKGLQRYTVSLTQLKDEANYVNNNYEFYINVLDSRQKILLVYNAPHPDIAALSSSINSIKTFELNKIAAIDFNPNGIQKFSLIIAHGLQRNHVNIINTLQQQNIPTLFIGMEIPEIASGVKISLTNNRTNNVEPSLNKDFSLFTLTDNIQKLFDDAPAILSPFGNYQSSNGFHTLLWQQIGQVTTQSPLAGFNTSGPWKTASFFSDGIWRWKLNAFARTNSHEGFNEFIQKTISFLSLKADKSFFRISGKRTFAENESIELLAEVYNQSYELINTPEVKINIKDSLNNEYNYAFSKSNNAYKLNAGYLNPGKYDYTASVKVDDNTYLQRGSFSVISVVLESVQLTADHQLLNNISQSTGGKMFYPDQLNSLKDSLLNNSQLQTVSYIEQSFNELINLKAVFFVLLGLLTLEWFLRKYNGAF